MRVGQTETNRILDRLLEMAPKECQTVIQVAREYGDHPDIIGPAIPSGTKLMKQIKWALMELGYLRDPDENWIDG